MATFWDRTYAYKLRLRRLFKTPEEAARAYDKVAIGFSGPEGADTNFPITPEAVAAAGEREEGASSGITCAALRLLSLEDMLAPDSTADDTLLTTWQDWRDRVWERYATRQPRLAMVPGLAAELAWLLRQVKEACIMPAWRGAPLAGFLEACAVCTLMGHKTQHYSGDAATCEICAYNLHPKQGKQPAGRAVFQHGARTLAALLRSAMDSIISWKAMEACSKGMVDGADAAAQEHQRRVQVVLAERLPLLQGPQIVPRPTPKNQPTVPTRAAKQQPAPAPTPPTTRAARAPAPAPPPMAGAARAEKAQAEKALEPGLRVIVIGAGVAGLKAAGDLQRAGAQVTVVEARERVGGRVHTARLAGGGTSQPVDLGATFVCGTSREPPMNPMLAYAADRLRLAMRPKHRDGPNASAVYDRHNRRLKPKELEAAEEAYAEVLGQLLEAGQKAHHDQSIGDTVQGLLAAQRMKPAQREVVAAYFCDLYVTTMDRLSLRGMVSSGFDGDHELVAGGYGQVVEALLAGVPAQQGKPCRLQDVRTGHVVRRVQLLPQGGVAVHIAGQAEPLRADAVLVTLPLGVLRAKSVRFSPALPAFKAEAIAGLEMGTENRVAMLFPKVFWPAECHFLRPVEGRYTFANLHALGVTNVLCAWVRPHAVAEVEALSDEEALADVAAVLRGLYRAAYVAPLAHAVTRWASHPFSLGSYSYVPAGSRKGLYDAMAWPVAGVVALDERQARCAGRALEPATRLFWAGEATHKEDAYTVHGAYMSGEREARRIKRWWRNFHVQVKAGSLAA